MGTFISGDTLGAVNAWSSLHDVSIMMASKHNEKVVKQMCFMIFGYLVVNILQNATKV